MSLQPESRPGVPGDLSGPAGPSGLAVNPIPPPARPQDLGLLGFGPQSADHGPVLSGYLWPDARRHPHGVARCATLAAVNRQGHPADQHQPQPVPGRCPDPRAQVHTGRSRCSDAVRTWADSGSTLATTSARTLSEPGFRGVHTGRNRCSGAARTPSAPGGGRSTPAAARRSDAVRICPRPTGCTPASAQRTDAVRIR